METRYNKNINPAVLKKRSFSSCEDELKNWKEVAAFLLDKERTLAKCLVCGSDDHSNLEVTVFDIDFVRCPECTHLYHKYSLNQKDIFAFFEQDKFVNIHVDEEQFMYRTEHVSGPKVEEVLRFAPKTGKWLDIACGAGALLYAVKKKGYDAYGFDINEPGCDIAKKFGLNVEQSDLYKYYDDHPDLKFDVVSMVGFLDLVPDPINSLKTVGKMLNPGGLVAIDQPRSDSFCVDLIREFPETSLRYLNPLQRSVYSEKSLKLLLEKCGFELEFYWKFGLDFYDFLSTISLKIPKFKNTAAMRFFIDNYNSFQKVIDEKGVSDTMFMVARKKG